MQPLCRTALSAARTGRSPALRQVRRYAHDAHGHGHGHGSHGVDEPMGMGFWVTFATFPAGIALYNISRANADGTEPFITRMIARYMETQEENAIKNDRHVRMLEQIGKDRVLFYNTKPQEFIDLSFPEIMNVGSPYNVPAGSQVQMDKVIEKYRKMAYEENERKLEALMNNKIKAEEPIDARNPHHLTRLLRFS